MNLGCATGHPSFVMSNSFTNQVLAQLDLWKNKTPTKSASIACPRSSTKKSPACTCEKIGVKLTKLTEKQADYIGVPVEGPYKPEHYRY